MEVLYGTCSGVDVHKKLLVVCLRRGKKSVSSSFSTTTQELFDAVEWLKNNGCEMVAMESTGSYWKPLYNVLEAMEVPAMVVNAQHMKAVPGRKTDMKDAEWIADLCQHGLLKASYIPDKEQRELRELVRYRKSLIEDRSRELNRLQKMLEGGNIKVSGTIGSIDGESSMNLLKRIINGEKIDEKLYDEMYAKKEISHNLKCSKEQLIADMNGILSELQKRIMSELLRHVEELDAHISNLDREIEHFNLVAQDVEIRKGSEQEKALAASVRCDDALRETLTEKQKEQFALCAERRNDLLTVFEKEAFIRGFKLGARMAAEVLSED